VLEKVPEQAIEPPGVFFQMSVTVRIPTPLRRMTNGKDKVEVASTVLGELVDNLNSEFPGFKDRLVDEEGELRYFVNIYLNGEDVRFMDGLGTATNDGDEISIVPAVAGGF
jgi:molybdopterin synthase sulfur carrier subunit